MRITTMLLVALAAAPGWRHWDDRSDTKLQVTKLLARGLELRSDPRYTEQPDNDTDAATVRADRRALLADCLAAEDDCRKEMLAHPDSISQVYLFLYARNVSDRVANQVLVDYLGAVGITQLPDAGAGFTVPEYVDQARERIQYRAGEDGPGEPVHEDAFLRRGTLDFSEIGW
jgi:hypothetical protein